MRGWEGGDPTGPGLPVQHAWPHPAPALLSIHDSGTHPQPNPDPICLLARRLFQHVAGVVHHGGAGTTAAGLYAGRPTWIVAFMGDQVRGDGGPLEPWSTFLPVHTAAACEVYGWRSC